VDHDGLERRRKEATSGVLEGLDEIGHLQQVMRAAEACGLVPAEMLLFHGVGDIRRVPRLDRRFQLRLPLAEAFDAGVRKLVLRDAGLLDVGVTLLFKECLHLSRLGGGHPHDQFFAARCVSPAHQPPGGSRPEHRHRPDLSQDLTPCPHHRLLSCPVRGISDTCPRRLTTGLGGTPRTLYFHVA
jgi:hypothetical protein